MLKPLLTVIMPVYNAERTIETALKSIRMQTIPAEQIEILAIDGGSTDATRDIAQRYGAIVLDNPYRLPEPAKRIGLQHAQGHYVMWQDSDEELMTSDQLQKRLALIQSCPEMKCIVCDEQIPGKHGGIAAHYLCVCGDPFTQFVYRRRNGVVATFKKAVSQQNELGCLLRFTADSLTPIGDGGTTMFDWEWTKEAFSEEWDTQQFACTVYSRICSRTGCCGCIPGDHITHHASARFQTYLLKLKFRVINNLFHPEESGYAARIAQKAPTALLKRKYNFVLYSVSLVGPLFDSIYLAIRHRDASFLLHFMYVYYVCIEIFIGIFQKFFGKMPLNGYYGKKQKDVSKKQGAE